VTTIQVQGLSTSDFNKIKEDFIRYFSEIYSEETLVTYLDPRGLLARVPKKMGRTKNQQLIRLVTLEEVKSALDEMEDDKSPGPNGFTTCFLKVCWDIIKRDLHRIILKFNIVIR